MQNVPFFLMTARGFEEIMCAERCLLSGEWEGAGNLLRPQPQTPVGTEGADSRVCVHKHTCMHTGSTAVFGQSTVVRDLLCWGPPWLLQPSWMHQKKFKSSPLISVSPSSTSASINDFHLLPLSGESSFIKSQMKPDHISCESWVTR